MWRAVTAQLSTTSVLLVPQEKKSRETHEKSAQNERSRLHRLSTRSKYKTVLKANLKHQSPLVPEFSELKEDFFRVGVLWQARKLPLQFLNNMRALQTKKHVDLTLESKG